MEDIDRREFNGLVLKVLAAAATGSLFSCGSKEESNNSQEEVSGLDEVLELAQSNIQKEDYQKAIGILEEYKTDDKSLMANKNLLLADAYGGTLYHTAGRNVLTLKEFYAATEKISMHLELAQQLNPSYQNAIGRKFVIYQNKAQQINDTSTPENAFRTLISAGVKKDIALIEKICGKYFDEVGKTMAAKHNLNFEETRKKNFDGFVNANYWDGFSNQIKYLVIHKTENNTIHFFYDWQGRNPHKRSMTFEKGPQGFQRCSDKK